MEWLAEVSAHLSVQYTEEPLHWKKQQIWWPDVLAPERKKIRKPVIFMELQRTDCMLPMKKWQGQRVPEKMELILYRS